MTDTKTSVSDTSKVDKEELSMAEIDPTDIAVPAAVEESVGSQTGSSFAKNTIAPADDTFEQSSHPTLSEQQPSDTATEDGATEDANDPENEVSWYTKAITSSSFEL